MTTRGPGDVIVAARAPAVGQKELGHAHIRLRRVARHLRRDGLDRVGRRLAVEGHDLVAHLEREGFQRKLLTVDIGQVVAAFSAAHLKGKLGVLRGVEGDAHVIIAHGRHQHGQEVLELAGGDGRIGQDGPPWPCRTAASDRA